MENTNKALIVLLLIAGGVYICLTRAPASEDKSGFDVLNWPPNRTEMCSLVAAHGTDPHTPAGLAARERYVTLFKKRYRAHDPMMAIGLRFPPSGPLDLLTPARMEPWSMDRLAVNAWQETRQAFGHPFDIDLYITYIGSAPIKVGELRMAKDSPNNLEIVHFKQPIIKSRERGVAVRN